MLLVLPSAQDTGRGTKASHGMLHRIQLLGGADRCPCNCLLAVNQSCKHALQRLCSGFCAAPDGEASGDALQPGTASECHLILMWKVALWAPQRLQGGVDLAHQQREMSEGVILGQNRGSPCPNGGRREG